jgi:hypothetical protein
MSWMGNNLKRDKSDSTSGQNVEINVKCHSGFIYADEPRSLIWQEKELGIKSVEKAWNEPGRRIFRVVTEDGRLFELCYNEQTDRWSAVESMP